MLNQVISVARPCKQYCCDVEETSLDSTRTSDFESHVENKINLTISLRNKTTSLNRPRIEQLVLAQSCFGRVKPS